MDESKIKEFEILFVILLTIGSMTTGIAISLIITIETTLESLFITTELSMLQINELMLEYAISDNPMLKERVNDLKETVGIYNAAINDYENIQIENKRVSYLLLYLGFGLLITSVIPGRYLLRIMMKKKKN